MNIYYIYIDYDTILLKLDQGLIEICLVVIFPILKNF